MAIVKKFQESDAFVFLNAMRMGGDTQVVRHFLKSMKDWDKELINARNKNKTPEME